MTNESLFQPVRTRRGFEAVCDRIREQLMSGELKPGDQLPGERELAERFGIGRAAARDALRSLEGPFGLDQQARERLIARLLVRR